MRDDEVTKVIIEVEKPGTPAARNRIREELTLHTEQHKPLKVGEIVHVRVQHGRENTCHAALITDLGFGGPFAQVFPCGRCAGVAARISLMDIQWHRIDEC